MRSLSTRIFSLLLALVLCVSTVCVGGTKVSAAEVHTITITPLVTDSVNKQEFSVTTNVDAEYSATVDGVQQTGTIAVGTQKLTFNSKNVVSLSVYSDEAFVTANSTTAYWLTVKCVADDGKELKSENVKLSKINDPQVVYNAPAVFDAGDFEYRAVNPSVLIAYGEESRTIEYKKVAKDAKTVTINYVDELDAVLYTETKVLNYGDTAVISAPATYVAGENTYVL